MWGKLNLPMFLFNVGLLTLMNMDSMCYQCVWQTFDLGTKVRTGQGPNFVVTTRHPPNLEYIMAIGVSVY